MYSSASRILHINEVARVPSSLVASARERGRDWRLHRIPAATPPWGAAAWARARDFVDSAALRRGADLLHVHYGPNGYYAWGARVPVVLHLHGTDIRIDINRPGHGALLRRSLRMADLVLYSTPDLDEWVAPYRSDAIYLPNPLPEAFLTVSTTPRTRRLVFATRWDDSKGGIQLVDAARALVAHGIDVHGFDWGVLSSQAREAGVICHPYMGLAQLRDFLAGARLVVGQQAYRALAMLDLQALAQGVPVVSPFSAPGTIPSTLPSLTADILRAWEHSDADLEQAGESGRAWVETYHGPNAVLAELEGHYTRLLA